MKNISLTIKSLIVTGLFIAGISTALAFTVPGGAPPDGILPDPNVPEPIHTGTTNQTKTGGIIAEFLLAGSGFNQPSNLLTFNSFAAAKTLAGAPYGLFMSDHALISGTDSKLKIGSTGALTSPLIGPSFRSGYTTPLSIDLIGRGNGPSGRNAAEIISGDNSCLNTVSVLTDASAVRFVNNQNPGSNDNNNRTVDLMGRQVRLSGGNPGALRVLVATNDKGDAAWGTMTIVNGQVKVLVNGQPVADGQSPVTSAQLCTTPPPPPTVCPSGQEAQGNICICSSGIREGQVPSTNTQTTAKIVDYVNGQSGAVSGGSYPFIPNFVLLEELRHNGGPGNSCQIKAFDPACPPFDLDTVNSQNTFVLDGITYKTSGGNSWMIDSKVGDQCTTTNAPAPVGPNPLIYNIERYP